MDVGRPVPAPRPAPPAGPYLVAGLGRAGCAAVGALCDHAGPAAVSAWDGESHRELRRLRRALEGRGVRVHLGRVPPDLRALGTRTLIKSPGIAYESAVVREALAAGVEVMDELELGWRRLPSRVVAVTGTNGKSTVAGLIQAVLEETGEQARLAGNTDLGPPLSALASGPRDWAVCEVSSFQLEGCPTLLPEVAVFTNLTREHLSRHGSMRRYAAAKRRLFIRGDATPAASVIDVDGHFGEQLAHEVELRGGRVVRVGTSPEADYGVVDSRWDLRGGTCTLRTPRGHVELTSRLPGLYNARNVAAALATADVLGVDLATATRATASYPGVPGRFELVAAGQDCDVIVDFAHTPDGMEQFLVAVRAGMADGSRLTTVLGLGGQHDPVGHRAMGRTARSLSDRLVLTTSGYRGRPPLVPLHHFLTGARSAEGAQLDVVLDRRDAIATAVEAAGPGDVVVIPGRGALGEMRAGGGGLSIPFDDRVVARELLRAGSSVAARQL